MIFGYKNILYKISTITHVFFINTFFTLRKNIVNNI